MKKSPLFCLLVFLGACAENVPEAINTPDDSGNARSSFDDTSLDLREANVIDVSYDASTGRFGVTLLHDDDNEQGYADWWQVETLEGEILGRRVLAHRHDNNPFTRYQTISDLQGADYVVIRGHDQDHGYGGQVVIFNAATGEMEKVRQGSDVLDFSNHVPDI